MGKVKLKLLYNSTIFLFLKSWFESFKIKLFKNPYNQYLSLFEKSDILKLLWSLTKILIQSNPGKLIVFPRL